MEGIQLQDIIRQTLDDIILTIEKVKEPDSVSNIDIQLNQYTENCKLLQLAIKCINNIKKNLENSIDIFSKKSTEVNQILTSIENEKNSFISNTNEVNKNQQNSEILKLQNVINSEIKDFENFSTLIQSYQTEQDEILDNVKQIQTAVTLMARCFTSFSQIFSNLP